MFHFHLIVSLTHQVPFLRCQAFFEMASKIEGLKRKNNELESENESLKSNSL